MTTVWSALDAPLGEVEPDGSVVSEAVASAGPDRARTVRHRLERGEGGARRWHQVRAPGSHGRSASGRCPGRDGDAVRGILAGRSDPQAAGDPAGRLRRCASRVAEIEDGTYLTTDQVLRAVTTADLERAVLTPDGRVSVSHKARLFTGAERRAIEVRDRTCTELGCEVAPDRCEADHIERFEGGGPTLQVNGRLRCVDHHEGRRADPEKRPQPWEYAEDEWGGLEAARFDVLGSEPMSA